MKQITFPWSGGIPGYGDARVDGRYAVFAPGSGGNVIQVNTGAIPLPAGQPALFVRLPRIGNRIACTGGKDDYAYEWNGVDAWVKRDHSCGVNPVIYDKNDRLVVAKCEPAVGSQGWRYLDTNGNLVSGDKSYADTKRGVFEFTDYGDVVIGQGSPTGVIVRFAADGVRRVLTFGVIDEHSDARNIRVDREGELFCITAVDYHGHVTSITHATLAELLALPPAVAQQDQTPEPKPAPKPAPKPEPKEEPKKLEIPNYYTVIKAVADQTKLLGKGGTNDERTQNAALFTRIAAYELYSKYDARFGLISVKPPHSNVNGLSADKLCFVSADGCAFIDIVVASESASAKVSWAPDDGEFDRTRWVKPEPVGQVIPFPQKPEPPATQQPAEPQPVPPVQPALGFARQCPMTGQPCAKGCDLDCQDHVRVQLTLLSQIVQNQQALVAAVQASGQKIADVADKGVKVRF